MYASALQRAASELPSSCLSNSLAASAKRGKTEGLTSCKLVKMPLDEALITSSGYGTPIFLNLIPAYYSMVWICP